MVSFKEYCICFSSKYYDNLPKIGGLNEIIEIDESKFGKRKYNRGHKVDGVWILGMIEKKSKKIILVQVDDRKLKTLNDIIISYVDPNSEIRTDKWNGYSNLKDHFSSHETVNHSLYYKDPVTNVHTNTIEGSWAGIKMHIPPRGRTKTLITMYLIRYMIIKNENEAPFKAILNYLF